MTDRAARNDRQHPRVTVDAFVRVMNDETEREYVFRVRDLSFGGLFLYTRVGHLYPFFVGSALHIELYDYDQAVALQAVIVRVVESGTPEAERFPAGFGVRIVQLDDSNRGRLETLIQRAQKGEAIY
jgi:hypothetical protein